MNKLEKLIQKYCPNGVEYRKLGEIIDIHTGTQFNKIEMQDTGKYPCMNGGICASGYSDKWNELENTITISQGGASAGYVNWISSKFWAGAHCYIIKSINNNVNPKYLYFFLKDRQKKIMESKHGAGIPGLGKDKINSLLFPLPPLPVQEEIVRILDNFTSLTAELQAELQARKAQYEFYRNKLLNFNDIGERERERRCKLLKMSEIGQVCMCKRIMKSDTRNQTDIPFYKIGTFGGKANAYISKSVFEIYKAKYNYPRKGEILLSAAGTIGKTVVFDGKPAYFQDSNIVWVRNDESKVLNSYLFYCYSMNPWKVSEGGTIPRLYNDDISNTFIPVPSLAEQERIVKILDKFDALVNDISKGLPAEIEARQKQYEYYRNKLLTFKKRA